jgi:hypothetical protein
MRLALLSVLLFAPVTFALDATRSISQYGHTMWTLQDGGLPGAPLPPPVHIEGLVANRTALSAQSGLRLMPHTRDLEIDYTALSLVVPRKNNFRYRLVGHDTDWEDAGARRQAFYTDLPPGNYRFQVIASNNEGRDRVYDLRKSTHASNDLPQALQAFAEELAQSADITQFRVTVEGTPRTLHLVVREETYRIGAEALTNAVRHSVATHVDTEISYSRKRDVADQ